MNFMPAMRLLFLMFCLLPPLLAAAGDDAPKVSCRFLRLDAKGADPELMHVAKDGVQVACKVPAHRLSEAVILPVQDGVLEFHTADGGQLAASARLPGPLKSAILIWVPNAGPQNGGLPWKVVVIDDSERNFPPGGAMVANFHNGVIRAAVGEGRATLEPAAMRAFLLPERRDDFNMAPVVVQFEQDGKWRTASESMLRFLPGIRYLVFAYMDPVSKRPRISTYQDITMLAPAGVAP